MIVDLTSINIIITLVFGGVNLAFILRLIHNHVNHLQQSVEAVRDLLIDHIRKDHQGNQ